METPSKIVCLDHDCIFKNSCSKWLDNCISDDEDDDEWYMLLPIEEHDTKKWTCHTSKDGRIL
jgi:hypothetical protein